MKRGLKGEIDDHWSVQVLGQRMPFLSRGITITVGLSDNYKLSAIGMRTIVVQLPIRSIAK